MPAVIIIIKLKFQRHNSIMTAAALRKHTQYNTQSSGSLWALSKNDALFLTIRTEGKYSALGCTFCNAHGDGEHFSREISSRYRHVAVDLHMLTNVSLNNGGTRQVLGNAGADRKRAIYYWWP